MCEQYVSESMTSEEDRSLLSNVLLPVAEEADARRTAAQLDKYDPGEITALYVIKKGSGPSATPVSKSGERGAEAFAAVREYFSDIAMETVFSDDIVATILEHGEEIDASAIVFSSRGGNRLLQFLTGDKTLKLVTKADRPVVTIPADAVEKRATSTE